MQYSFKCPACGQVLTVDAADKTAALEAMMEVGKQHATEHHPEMLNTPEDQMRAMLESGLQEGAGEQTDAPAAPADGGVVSAAETPVSTDAPVVPAMSADTMPAEPTQGSEEEKPAA